MTSSRCNEVEFIDVRETSCDIGEEFIVGRTEDKIKIVASLHQSLTQKFTILPIYGIGGIGKTTFAKLIYNDTNFKGHSRVWVYVSPRFDLSKVGNSIISQLSGMKSQISETLIYSRLKELLSGKNNLIVLDDLWEGDLFKLNNLKDMLNPGDSINTIVLVTTRSEHVAENISTNIKPYKIKFLTDDMCWDIIKQRSDFEGRDDKKELTDIGWEIALKCGGVALAAQSLGFMLRPMSSEQWVEVKDSDIWNQSISEDATLPNHVLASLKLSYTNMDICLRSCFTYCAIFPKGHRIIKRDLINQWISLGFIKPTKLLSSMQLCEKYIGQLLGLSFLQHTMDLKDLSYFGMMIKRETHQKDLTLFTMHDLVHDLARLLMADRILDASNTGGCDYRYALLTDCTIPLESLTDFPEKIRALFFGDCHQKMLHASAFLPAKCLQVLDLSECILGELPPSIGELVQLRYLNAPRIISLPASFTRLSELTYLNLSGSKISALPNSIGEIKGLMHLDISDCESMRKLPESFANLKKLVYLNLSNCQLIKLSVAAFGGLTNIQHLNLSRIRLYTNDDKFKIFPEVICNLTELRYLGLSICSNRRNAELAQNEMSSFIEHICTLHNLVHLDLSYSYGLVSLPESIGSLRNLHTLDLSCCIDLVTLPECMLKMNSLKIVYLTNCDSLQKSTLSGSKYFASLPYFMVHADDDESCSNIGLLRHVYSTVLHISRLENVMSAEEVESIKLSEKQGMKSLYLDWTTGARRSEDVEVLGKLLPPMTLNYFKLQGYHSACFPSWVMSIAVHLADLTTMVLWELRKCNSLPPLGQLPRLEKLVIGRMDSIRTIEEGFCAGARAFRKLNKFHLCHMENLELWNTTYSYVQDDDVHQRFMFPNLENLLISDCPKLRLRPCPPDTKVWEIENSDNVLSSWDEEGEIDHAALLSAWRKWKQIRPGVFEINEQKVFTREIKDALFARGFTPYPHRWDQHKMSSWVEAERDLFSALLSCGKCRRPGAFYHAYSHTLKVKSSKLPFDQWRLFHHLLPSYRLSITCCPYLTSSSREIIQDLSSISTLYLEDDSDTNLPKWFCELTSLNKLGITGYQGLEAPLKSMKQLPRLQYLWLSNCRRMSTLPQWLGKLISLQKLIISDWENLSDLPECMRHLTSLQVLCLKKCPKIKALPEWMGDLASLYELTIDCKGMESLPDSIQKLTKLRKLTVHGHKLAQWCKLVENSKKLSHIQHKNMYNFSMLMEGKKEDEFIHFFSC